MNFFSKTIPLSRRQILFPIAILFFTLATNGIILALCGYNPWEAVQVAIVGAFGDGRRITETLVKSVPFLFTGLAVAFSFRCGIWNIGAEGQFLLGAIASTWCGTQIAPHLPPILAIPLTLLAGAAAGGIWALMAALLKVYRGVQEVISTIMLNYVAVYLLSYMVDGGPLQEAAKRGPQSDMIAAAAYLPRLIPQTRFHLGLPLAIALAILLSIVLFRTVSGYQIRAVGSNPKAAQAAGISISKNVILALVISGALAGLGGAIELTALTRRSIPKLFARVRVYGNRRSPVGEAAPALGYPVFSAVRSAEDRFGRHAADGGHLGENDIRDSSDDYFLCVNLRRFQFPGTAAEYNC